MPKVPPTEKWDRAERNNYLFCIQFSRRLHEESRTATEIFHRRLQSPLIGECCVYALTPGRVPGFVNFPENSLQPFLKGQSQIFSAKLHNKG